MRVIFLMLSLMWGGLLGECFFGIFGVLGRALTVGWAFDR